MSAETTVAAPAPPTAAEARVTTRRSGRGRRITGLVLRYLLLTLLAFVVLFPIYITVVNSLLRPDRIAARPPAFFPTSPDWSTYATAWSDGHMATYLRNSFIVTGIITVGEVVTAILAGYAFAFLRFPFKRTLFVVFLATLMVPFEVTIVTNLQTINSLGWYDTYAALAVPFLATGFGAFLLRQAFLTVPRDLQDAAKLDGYGHLRFMTRVAVPIARPAGRRARPLRVPRRRGTSTCGRSSSQGRPASYGPDRAAAAAGTSIDQVNVTFAGVIIAAMPLFILLLVFQKQLVRGLTAGAVKG